MKIALAVTEAKPLLPLQLQRRAEEPPPRKVWYRVTMQLLCTCPTFTIEAVRVNGRNMIERSERNRNVTNVGISGDHVFCCVFLLFPGGSIYLLYYVDQLDGSTPTFLHCLVVLMDNFQSQQSGPEAP